MNENLQSKQEMVEKIRQACVQAAIAGFEQGRLDGLCEEGAVETAVSYIQKLNFDQLLRDDSRHK